jgi:hypothetical protein
LPALISVKATVYSAAEQRSVTFSWQSAFLAPKPYPLNAFGHPGAAYVEENLKSLEELMSCRTIHDCLALRRMARAFGPPYGEEGSVRTETLGGIAVAA